MKDGLTDVVPLVAELFDGAVSQPLNLVKLVLHFAIVVGVQYQPPHVSDRMAFAYPPNYMPPAQTADAAIQRYFGDPCERNEMMRLINELAASQVFKFNGDRRRYNEWKAGFMAKIAHSPNQFKSEKSKLRLLMSSVSGLAFDVLNKTYGDEARDDAGPGTLRLEDALAELEFTFRCLEHEDATLQLLKLRMGKDQLFADFFPHFMALVNRGARTCHGACEDDRSKKLALQACLPARFGNIAKKYVTEDHGSFKEFVDECFASEGWKKSPEPPKADTTMCEDDVVCVSEDGYGTRASSEEM
ncbi:uncharacterized protein J3D65DRAFT_665655 [Phyllosticta citribraziliensis]|uniref:Uncharacterized protein n=1 Tax=Phyllosticta citribraziliensis TaxID=989973 RepID=A0ABR1M3I2_9PEZI